MTNDNTRTKANAVFFSVLMVLSMVAIGFAAAPAAATAGNNGDNERPDTDTATKDVNTTVPGVGTAIVFQGEAINFTGALASPATVTGVSGAADGQVIDLSRDIPTDQTTGTYSVDGTAIDANQSGMANPGFTVLEPAITTAEVILTSNNNSVSRVKPGTSVNITAEYNFEDAENISLSVEDESGTDVTNEVLDSVNQTIKTSGGEAGLDLSEQDAGEYTIIFEGDQDLDYSAVVEEYSITKTNDVSTTIDIAADSATQGDNIEYTISGGTDGEEYLVVIEDGDYAEGVSNGNNAANIFRNVGDTTDATNHTGDGGGGNYAYANVTIDGTQAVGEIETQYVDDSSVTVDVYGPGVDNNLLNGVANGSNSSVDDDSIEINAGELTLGNPSGTYTVGEEIDVTGTSQSSDRVRLYAQNNNQWEIVDLGGTSSDVFNISVESDDTFEEEDVTLSAGDASGNDILSFAGNYRIGLIDDTEAANLDSDNGNNIDGSTITTSQWTSASSTRATISVVEGQLSGEFLTYNGQVADTLDDEVDVEGTAEGQSEVLVVFVGDRGQIQTHQVSVDSDGTFDESDLATDQLNQGVASGHIISLGRDGVFGDKKGGIDQLDNNVSNIGSGASPSGAQVRERVVALTTGADASDDLMVSQTFRLGDGQVSIDTVAPEGSDAAGINPVAAGDTMVVTGTTNRQPGDNSIVVNIFDAESNSVVSEDTDEWGTDGQFSVAFDTSELETGQYSVEADTGDNTDRTEIEIVDSVEEETEEAEEETEEETEEEETTEEETEEETTEEETTEEETTEEETEEEATDDSTPGFGALVALVALVAAALLATRRRDE
jgi:major cell surface glycoprotein (TIGR04216 family)